MKDYVGDPFAFSHLVGMAEALRAELEFRNLPELCSLGVQPGASVAYDFGECEGGMGWTRLGAMYPSSERFPNPDANRSRYLAVATSVEMGIIRPSVVPDNGEAPDSFDLFEAARLQTADMAAMLQVLCAYPAAHDLRSVIGTYTPVGPQGGMLGGSWSIIIQGD